MMMLWGAISNGYAADNVQPLQMVMCAHLCKCSTAQLETKSTQLSNHMRPYLTAAASTSCQYNMHLHQHSKYKVKCRQ